MRHGNLDECKVHEVPAPEIVYLFLNTTHHLWCKEQVKYIMVKEILYKPSLCCTYIHCLRFSVLWIIDQIYLTNPIRIKTFIVFNTGELDTLRCDLFFESSLNAQSFIIGIWYVDRIYDTPTHPLFRIFWKGSLIREILGILCDLLTHNW